MSDDEEAESCAICRDADRQARAEAFYDTPEIKAYAKKLSDQKEVFLKKMIRKHMKLRDRPIFWIYTKLADYFSGGDRISVLQMMDSHEDVKIGIRIYGEEYWMEGDEQKKTTSYGERKEEVSD